MANKVLESWALPRMQQLLPIDDESLKQIIQYAETLPKDAAAEHLKNLLGDDGKSLEFISSFNLRRQNAPATSAPAQPTNHDRQQQNAEAPRGGGGRGGRGGKKRANIHALPARQVEGHGNVTGAYLKRDEDDEYMPHASSSRSRQQTHKDTVADNLALRSQHPDATQMPLITDDASATSKPITSKPPPSAAGALISDSLAPRNKSRTSSPSAPNKTQSKTKVHLTGGTAMHGASTALSDLDSAIKTLELQTNPTLHPSATEDAARKCPCMATRHPLLDIAPNCLSCGQIICVKQGLGPCTSCGTPLLSPDEIAKVLRVLKDERGEAKMQANNAAHKKADVVNGKPRAFTGRDFLAQTSASPSPLSSALSSDDESSSAAAKAHRDKLLTYQSNNARRTRIHDEAADYDVPTSGTNMWASPAERAQQLKRQQKILREVEWNARPDYEKRRVVASIDLKGGRVVRRMAEMERPAETETETEEDGGAALEADPETRAGSGGGGAFSRNPLAKGLIRPVWKGSGGEEGGKGKGKEENEARDRGNTTWRRVQMDEDDNEQWILDGGVYGGREGEVASGNTRLGVEEHAFG